jgi:hypothetical protein
MRIVMIAVLLVALACGGGWTWQNWSKQKSAKPVAKLGEDAENLFVAFQKYKEVVGAYPVGSNAEIARALKGQNPKNLIILVARKNELNEKGEFVDPWGTPLMIYFAGNSVLVRSAGPNKMFEDSQARDGDDVFLSN